MLVYLAPCGIGLGHTSRSLAIAREVERRGGEAIFSTYGEAVEFVRRHGFKVLRSYGIEYSQNEDGSFDLWSTIAHGPVSLYRFSRQLGNELYYIGVLKPGVVISDSRLSTSLAAYLRRAHNMLVANQLLIIIPTERRDRNILRAKNIVENFLLQTMYKIWERSDLILVPDFPPPYTISKQNLVFEGKELEKVGFVGPLISTRPEELGERDELRRELGIDDRKLVLVMASGTMKEKEVLVKEMIQILEKICRERDDIQFLVSKAIPGSQDTAIHQNGNLSVCDWLEEKFKYLKVADVVASHGGHTIIAESMYYGVPMILTPTRGHTERRGNAESISSLGIAYLLPQKDLTGRSFKKALRMVLERDSYTSRAREVAAEVNRYDSAPRVVDLMEEVLGKRLDSP